jgi:hypothetical protein
MRDNALVIDGGRVPVDICVYFFNIFSGVDRVDQVMSFKTCKAKSRCWSMTVLFYMLDASRYSFHSNVIQYEIPNPHEPKDLLKSEPVTHSH